MSKPSLNDPANVLDKLAARVKDAFEAAADTIEQRETPHDKRLQLLERMEVLGEVQQWIAEARIADLREIPTHLHSEILLREHCQSLAGIYEDYGNFLGALVLRAPPELAGLLTIERDFTLHAYAMLSGFAGARSSDQWAEVDRLLATLSSAYEDLKKQRLSHPLLRGAIH